MASSILRVTMTQRGHGAPNSIVADPRVARRPAQSNSGCPGVEASAPRPEGVAVISQTKVCPDVRRVGERLTTQVSAGAPRPAATDPVAGGSVLVQPLGSAEAPVRLPVDRQLVRLAVVDLADALDDPVHQRLQVHGVHAPRLGGRGRRPG